MWKKGLLFFSIIMCVGLFTSCRKGDIGEATGVEVIEENKDKIMEIKLENKLKDAKEVFSNNSGIEFKVQLSEYEFLVSVPNEKEFQYDKKISGFGDTLYKYNIKTKEYSEYLKARDENYIIDEVYLFDEEWLVWIESDLIVKDAQNSVGGNYNIVCKNIKTNEIFFIEEKNLSKHADPDVSVIVNPTEISYSKGKIAYSYFEVSGNEYKRCHKTFDLKTKKGKLHFKEEYIIRNTVSNITILNDMLAFVDGNNNLYYFNINDEPKVFKKLKSSLRVKDSLITEENIYTINERNEDDGVYTVLEAHNIRDKKSNIILSEDNYNGEFKFWTMDLIEDNIIFNRGLGKGLIYNIKSSKVIDLYKNELSKDIENIIFGESSFKDYLSILYYEDDVYLKEYIIKYQ